MAHIQPDSVSSGPSTRTRGKAIISPSESEPPPPPPPLSQVHTRRSKRKAAEITEERKTSSDGDDENAKGVEDAEIHPVKRSRTSSPASLRKLSSSISCKSGSQVQWIQTDMILTDSDTSDAEPDAELVNEPKKSALSHVVKAEEIDQSKLATSFTSEEVVSAAGDDATASQVLADHAVPAVKPRRPLNTGRGRGAKRAGLARHNSATVSVAGIKKRKAGPGKRKVAANPLLQAAYDRQRDLKTAYKELAKLVKDGNAELAEEDLEKLKGDLGFHLHHPHHQRVLDRLDRIHSKRVSDLACNQKFEEAQLLKELEDKKELTRLNFEHSIRNAKENAIIAMKSAMVKLINGTYERDRAVAAGYEDTASIPDDDHCILRFEPEQPESVESVVTANMQQASGPSTPKKRGRSPKKISPAKRSLEDSEAETPIAKKPSLMSAAVQQADEEDDDEIDRPVSSYMGSKSAMGGAPVDPAIAALDTASNIETDEYGLAFTNRVRRGRMAPPNNRIVVKTWYKYDEGEIGLGAMTAKDGSFVQPKTIHFDSWGPTYRIADYNLADFDPFLIGRHKLHPTTGLPIPGSCNPPDAVAPTDFSKPLPSAKWVQFVTRDGKMVSNTSRSAPALETVRDWNKLAAKLPIKKILHRGDDNDNSAAGLATYDADARDKAETDRAISNLIRAGEDLPTWLARMKSEHVAPQVEVQESSLRDEPGPVVTPARRRKPGGKSATVTPNGLSIPQLDGAVPSFGTHGPMAPPAGVPGMLEALADAAEVVKQPQRHFLPPAAAPPPMSTKSQQHPPHAHAPLAAAPPSSVPQALQPLSQVGSAKQEVSAPPVLPPQALSLSQAPPPPSSQSQAQPQAYAQPSQMQSQVLMAQPTHSIQPPQPPQPPPPHQPPASTHTRQSRKRSPATRGIQARFVPSIYQNQQPPQHPLAPAQQRPIFPAPQTMAPLQNMIHVHPHPHSHPPSHIHTHNHNRPHAHTQQHAPHLHPHPHPQSMHHPQAIFSPQNILTPMHHHQPVHQSPYPSQRRMSQSAPSPSILGPGASPFHHPPQLFYQQGPLQPPQPPPPPPPQLTPHPGQRSRGNGSSSSASGLRDILPRPGLSLHQSPTNLPPPPVPYQTQFFVHPQPYPGPSLPPPGHHLAPAPGPGGPGFYHG